MSDIDLLKRALDFEVRRAPQCWEKLNIGATQADINRLLRYEFIELRHHSSKIAQGQYGPALYRLTDKGRQEAKEEPRPSVPAAEILEAMDLIVGFPDLKETIAKSIANRKRVHFLLEGPPAGAKSLFLQAVEDAVPDALMAFGSRTSGRGLSDELFEKKPSVLCLDEADKMKHDVFSLTLGLMEAGEIKETKADNRRRIKLDTMVIAACNGSNKMKPEFLSRFAMHAKFPHYTRDEFLDVVRSMLGRKGCPDDLAEMIGGQVLDIGFGDVRQARAVWDLMNEPTEEEALRVLRMKEKYRTGERVAKKQGVLV